MAVNEGRVYFALDGDDFDPNEVTKILGIEPTSILRKGTRIPNKVPRKSAWVFSTPNIKNEYIDVFEMASIIVEALHPKKNQIQDVIKAFSLSPRLEVVLVFSMKQKHSTPAIGFEAETIAFLGEIGAYIDIDTYKH